MRRVLSLGLLFALAGCGGEEELTPAGPGGGSGRPECAPCFDALVQQTDLCGPALDACLDDPTLPVEPIVACFDADGRCYDEALQRSAQCNLNCGDDAQAQVELCAGQCFLARAGCAERVVRGVDACLSACQGASCDLCTTNGQLEFDRCNAELEACSEQCVALRGP